MQEWIDRWLRSDSISIDALYVSRFFNNYVWVIKDQKLAQVVGFSTSAQIWSRILQDLFSHRMWKRNCAVSEGLTLVESK